MKSYRKKDFPLAKIRRFLEAGPIVLVSSAHEGERDVMTLGWHMMLRFEPADEKAIAKGHQYLTLVCDLDRATVEYLAEDRKQASLESYFTGLSADQVAGIEAIALDMWVQKGSQHQQRQTLRVDLNSALDIGISYSAAAPFMR